MLKALVDCYDFMAKSREFDITSANYSKAICDFELEIDKKGTLTNLVDLRAEKRGKSKIVPFQKSRSGSKKEPYFMCENSKYFLGKAVDKKKEVSYVANLESTIERYEEIQKLGTSIAMEAVLNFLKRTRDGETWDINLDSDLYVKGNMIFRLKGENNYIHDREEIKQIWEDYVKQINSTAKSKLSQCLITGKEQVEISKVHSIKIKGVYGGNSSGTTLIGVNMKSAESYGKLQAFNSPVSETAMIKYSTALNELLASKSNKALVGETTCVFWSIKESEFSNQDLLNALATGKSLMDKTEKEKQLEPNGANQIKTVMSKVLWGLNIEPEDIKKEEGSEVYIIGLKPNNARVSFNYWYHNDFENFYKNIMNHYEDIEIIGQEFNKKMPNLENLLRSMAVLGKKENIPKTLENSLFKSISEGKPYPSGAYQAILMRIRNEAGDEWSVNELRAGFIKAYLKRNYRALKLKEKEEAITVGLNENHENVAYQLGRLFSILEKTQQDANNGSNLRERYFASASTNPKLVFPSILKLSQNHIVKLSKGNKGYYLDNLGEDILNRIDGFPVSLSLEEQGLFVLGYYHQRKSLYTKKEEN